MPLSPRPLPLSLMPVPLPLQALRCAGELVAGCSVAQEQLGSSMVAVKGEGGIPALQVEGGGGGGGGLLAGRRAGSKGGHT